MATRRSTARGDKRTIPSKITHVCEASHFDALRKFGFCALSNVAVPAYNDNFLTELLRPGQTIVLTRNDDRQITTRVLSYVETYRSGQRVQGRYDVVVMATGLH